MGQAAKLNPAIMETHTALTGTASPRHKRHYLPIILLALAQVLAGTQTEARTMPDPRIREAIALMNAFAARTGLASAQNLQRYLWTDAFAVCNYLGLARALGEPQYTRLALQLVTQVHHVLGQHRDDDPRKGWISGLDEAEGERHPTHGGLRIGKPEPERGPREPYDERGEWDRDGQYFHYLTRWMHALDQVARATHDPVFNTWARELSMAAFDAFTYQPAPHIEPRRMAWKMSIDLSRPLVPSMGQHDPLEGYVSNLQLQSTAAALQQATDMPDLEAATRQYDAMLKRSELATSDPLGLGGLLIDAWRLQQLMQQGTASNSQLHERLLQAALLGLGHYARSHDPEQPASHRLAFRELGLAIGLHALERMHRAMAQDAGIAAGARQRALLEELMRYMPLRDDIETFWRNPEHQRTANWMEHQDINAVMLATALVPDGVLDLQPVAGNK
jgi:hypothetical protein